MKTKCLILSCPPCIIISACKQCNVMGSFENLACDKDGNCFCKLSITNEYYGDTCSENSKSFIIYIQCCQSKDYRFLTWLLCKIQHITTPTKWGILIPPCILVGYYPPTTDHMVWGSVDPPMGGYGVTLP